MLHRLLPLLLAALLQLFPALSGAEEPASHAEPASREEPASQEEPASRDEPLLASYYAGQESRALRMLRKSIFQSLLGQWAEGQNPAWDYDTFTAYAALDERGDEVPGEGEVFCCGYTADDGVCGYFVLSYSGEGLTRLDGAATPYPYDLRANLSGFRQALSGTQLDLETANATRVQVPLADGTRAEAVRFVDGEGRRALCRFGEDGPVLVSPIP